jgi:DNA-directed RNA polymerase I subunit RPA12
MDQFFAREMNVGGPAFCPHCSSILDLPETNNIVCSSCGYTCRYTGKLSARLSRLTMRYVIIDLPSLCTVTFSEDKPEPKWFRSQTVSKEVTGPARATVSFFL